MTSQLVIRIEGYPDEVVVAGTTVGVEVVTPQVAADVATTRVAADIEVQVIPAQP
jgi:hypothetical protein